MEYARLERERDLVEAHYWFCDPLVEDDLAYYGAWGEGLLTERELEEREDILGHRRRLYRSRLDAAEERFKASTAALQCSVCGDFVYSLGLCQSCYNFRRKHKRDRTEDEVVARNRHLNDREAIREEHRAARRVLLERDH